MDSRDHLGLVHYTDGSIETIPTTLKQIDGVWCLVFSADDFSPYALVISEISGLQSVTGSRPSVLPRKRRPKKCLLFLHFGKIHRIHRQNDQLCRKSEELSQISVHIGRRITSISLRSVSCLTVRVKMCSIQTAAYESDVCDGIGGCTSVPTGNRKPGSDRSFTDVTMTAGAAHMSTGGKKRDHHRVGGDTV